MQGKHELIKVNEKTVCETMWAATAVVVVAVMVANVQALSIGKTASNWDLSGDCVAKTPYSKFLCNSIPASHKRYFLIQVMRDFSIVLIDREVERENRCVTNET